MNFMFLAATLWVQNEPFQDVAQWYVDYIELKATLATSSRETSALPSTT